MHCLSLIELLCRLFVYLFVCLRQAGYIRHLEFLSNVCFVYYRLRSVETVHLRMRLSFVFITVFMISFSSCNVGILFSLFYFCIQCYEEYRFTCWRIVMIREEGGKEGMHVEV